MLQKINSIKQWIYKNPKKFYRYSMIVIATSFVLNMIYGIWFEKKGSLTEIKVPELYLDSDLAKQKIQNNEKEMEKVVRELQAIKRKLDTEGLSAGDSIRIEYLYNKYETLKRKK